MKPSSGVALGPYELVERLGCGSVTTLYRARHKALKGFVAIKVLHEYFTRDAGARRRFLDAARAHALLNHPHIANVFDYGYQDGSAYLAMELADEGSLEARSRPIHVAELVGLLSPVAEALDSAHARGTLHLNIKPANILIRSDGTASLADFGLDQLGGRAAGGLGPSEYRSPEQANGAIPGPEADRYSLAVVCREMLTGLVPFRPGSSSTLVAARPSARIRPVHGMAFQLPSPVEDVLDRGMAAIPSSRYPSSVELVATLNSAAGFSGC
ncbi:MAG: serine/threonine-protein kinase [Candidatus Dormibacteraceae bacterium]